MSSVLIRAKLTADEWRDLRKLALDRNEKISVMVGNALRESLLKGAKP